jgi:hypothetical protein
MPPDETPAQETTETVTDSVEKVRQDLDALATKVDTHIVHPVVTQPVETVTEPVVEPVVDEMEKVTPPPREEKKADDSPPKHDAPSHGMSKAWFG